VKIKNALRKEVSFVGERESGYVKGKCDHDRAGRASDNKARQKKPWWVLWGEKERGKRLRRKKTEG